MWEDGVVGGADDAVARRERLGSDDSEVEQVDGEGFAGGGEVALVAGAGIEGREETVVTECDDDEAVLRGVTGGVGVSAVVAAGEVAPAVVTAGAAERALVGVLRVPPPPVPPSDRGVLGWDADEVTVATAVVALALALAAAMELGKAVALAATATDGIGTRGRDPRGVVAAAVAATAEGALEAAGAWATDERALLPVAV